MSKNIISTQKQWNELRKDPEKWTAYLNGVEKRRRQMRREYLRKWKAVGGVVLDGQPALSTEANFTLPELALYTSVRSSFWLNLLKKGALKSFRLSEIDAYIDSLKVVRAA